jgi:hypothetical protein
VVWLAVAIQSTSHQVHGLPTAKVLWSYPFRVELQWLPQARFRQPVVSADVEGWSCPVSFNSAAMQPLNHLPSRERNSHQCKAKTQCATVTPLFSRDLRFRTRRSDRPLVRLIPRLIDVGRMILLILKALLLHARALFSILGPINECPY